MAKSPNFTSRLTPVECAMKTQAAIVAEAEVVGLAEDGLVLVRKNKGNMFQTVGRAEVSSSPDGADIMLTTGADRIVFVFSMFFLAAFLLIDLFFLLAYVRVFQSFQFSDQDRKDWLFVSLPFVTTLLGVGLYHLGRYQSRSENGFLIRLLVDAMDAKPKGKATKAARAEPARRTAAPKTETPDTLD